MNTQSIDFVNFNSKETNTEKGFMKFFRRYMAEEQWRIVSTPELMGDIE